MFQDVYCIQTHPMHHYLSGTDRDLHLRFNIEQCDNMKGPNPDAEIKLLIHADSCSIKKYPNITVFQELTVPSSAPEL